MANGVFNIAKGRVNEYQNRVDGNDPAGAVIIVTLLQATVADSALVDFAELQALLADAGNTEATFTNFARITLTDTDVVGPTVDNTNDRQESTIPNQTFANAGNGTNNNLVKLLICYNDGTAGDDEIIPMTHHDFVVTTDGSDLVAQIDAAGYFRAS